MAHVPIPDCNRVCLRFIQNEQRVCNVFHVQNSDPGDEASMQQVANAFKSWWDTQAQQVTSNEVALEAIEVKDMSVEDGAGIEMTGGLPLVGGVASSFPNNVTVAIKLTTGRTGRSYRGRSYFVGLPQSMVEASNANMLTSSARTTLLALYENLIDGLQLAGFPLAVASLVTGGLPRAAGVLTPVIAAAVNLVLDSQRRRLPERGQ